MKKNLIKIMMFIIIVLQSNSIFAINVLRTKQDYINVIKLYYSKLMSNDSLSIKETQAFFGNQILEMESYLFFKKCDKTNQKSNCDDLFQRTYYVNKKSPISCFFKEIRKQKLDYTFGYGSFDILNLIDSNSILIDENYPDHILIFIPFPNGKFVYFSMNKYKDEPITIINMYTTDGSSFYNKIYEKDKQFLKRKGMVIDSSGYCNIKKSSIESSSTIGKLSIGDEFYYTPNSNHQWWYIEKKGKSTIKGYVDKSAIGPKR